MVSFTSSVEFKYIFVCLISVANVSNIMFNRSVDSGPLVLFLIIEEKLSGFYH